MIVSNDFAQIFSYTPVASLVLSKEAPHYLVLRGNLAFTSLTGIPEGDIIEKSIWDLLSNLTRDPELHFTTCVLEALQSAQSSNSPVQLPLIEHDSLNNKNNGTRHFLKSEFRAVFDEQGEVNYILYSLMEVPDVPIDAESLGSGTIDIVIPENTGACKPGSNLSSKNSGKTAISESEANLRAIFDNSSEGLVLMDTKGRVKALNARAKRSVLLNVTSTEMVIGESILKYIDPARLEIFKQVLARASCGEESQYELSFKQRNGRPFWFNFFVYPVLELGKITGICMAVTDITKKKDAEELMITNEKRYRQLFYSNPLPMWIYDPESLQFLEVNDAAVNKYGYTRDEFLKLSIKNIRPGTDLNKLKKAVDNISPDHGNSSGQWTHVKKGGEKIEVEITSHLIDYAEKKAVLVLANDVSERINAEKQRNFERRDKEALINNTNDLIWSVNTDMKLIAANNAFIEAMRLITGNTIMAGDELLRADHFSKDYLKEWEGLYREALKGKNVKEEISAVDQGEEICLEMTVNPIYDGAKIVGLACYGRNITENKKFQKEILNINKKLEAAQQIAGIGYWDMDLETNKVFLSDQIYKIFSIPKKRDVYLLHELMEYIHPDDKLRVKRELKAAIGNVDELDIEYCISLPDGTNRNLHAKGSLVVDHLESAVRIQGTIQDITQRKLVEKAIQESEEKYRVIFTHSPVPIWIYEIETLNILDVNETAVAKYGYRREEFLALSAQEIRAKKHADLPRYIKENMNKSGGIDLGRVEHMHKSGRIMVVDVTGHRLNYEGKDCLMVAATDVTDAVRATEALMKSNERFEYVTKATSDAIYDWDLTKDELIWGEGFHSLFGYDNASISVNISSWHDHLHPDDRKRVIAEVEDAINDQSVRFWQSEYRYAKADKTYAFVIDRGMIIRDEAGKAYRMIGAMQDISKIKKHEIALSELNRDLDKRARELSLSNAELEQFAYIASHDLQEPLRMVTSFLSQLEKKYEDQLDEKAKKYIWFAVDGAARMRKIILDLLQYSRVGREDHKLEDVDMNEVLSDVLQLHRVTIKETGAKISFGTLPVIRASRSPMQQVLQNLIGNAMKYQPPGNNPRIDISNKEFGDHWEFAVSDNGIGIDPSLYDKIFILFQRLHNKDEYSGTGIGLTICKKIIESYDGHIRIDSEPGKGSTFYFTISKNIEHS